MKYVLNEKKILLITIIIFVIISLFSFKKYSDNISNYYYKTSYNNFIIDKVVIVGDSRMEFIYDKKYKLNIPNNFIFDAKSGATIEWLKTTGVPELVKILNNKKDYYKYHVIFNLGVNDIDYKNLNITTRAKDYYKIYNNLIKQYTDVNFYILSVNPIDESRIYKKFCECNNRTNKKIEEFNNYFIDKIKKGNLSNVKYCDSYNDMIFNLPDGLHYDDETDQKIIDYINNNCVNFSIPKIIYSI